MAVIQLLFLLALSAHSAPVNTRDGVTLTVDDQSGGQVSESTINTQIDMFFEEYPSMISNYNGAPTSVTLQVNPELSQGAVSAWSNGFGLSIPNLQSKPDDVDYLRFAIQFMLQSYSTKAPPQTTTTTLPPNSYTRNGLTLIVEDNSGGKVPSTTIQNQINAFFDLYPKATDIRGGTPTTLTLIIDPNTAYAAASTDHLIVGADWIAQRPADTNALSAAINQSVSGFPFEKDGVTINIQDLTSGIPSSTTLSFVNTFFTVYPKEVAYYKPIQKFTNLTFIYDPNYNGAAATEVAFTNSGAVMSGAAIRFSESFCRDPQEVDLITHEAMHVTEYGGAAAFSCSPDWMIEGMADFARNQFSVAAAGFPLPAYSSSQHYTDGYLPAAALITYVKKQTGKPIETQLFVAMQTCDFTDNTWTEVTGKSADQWWQEYASSSS